MITRGSFLLGLVGSVVGTRSGPQDSGLAAVCPALYSPTTVVDAAPDAPPTGDATTSVVSPTSAATSVASTSSNYALTPDDDTVLVKVKRQGDGNVCHTGERSCFYRKLDAL